MICAAIAGIAARLLLAWCGLGAFLAWRIEISTTANSNLELREGLALYRLGISPYSGSSCHTPPLVLWLYGALVEHDVLYVLTNTLLDLLAAFLLYRLASDLFSASRSVEKRIGTRTDSPSPLPSALAWVYLLNPFTLAASVGGTTSSLESLAVVATLYSACKGRPVLTALAMAVASQMSLHAAALQLPVACLLSYGPEDVATPLQLLAKCRTVPKVPNVDGSGAGGGRTSVHYSDDRSTDVAGLQSDSGALQQEDIQQQQQQQQQHEERRHNREVQLEGAKMKGDAKDGTVSESASGAFCATEALQQLGAAAATAAPDGATGQCGVKAAEQQPESSKLLGDALRLSSGLPGKHSAESAGGNATKEDERGDEPATHVARWCHPSPTTAGTSPPPPPPPRRSPLLPWRQLLQCVVLTAVMLAFLVLASDMFLVALPPRMGIDMQSDGGSGGGGGGGDDRVMTCILATAKQLTVTPAAVGVIDAGKVMALRLAAAGKSLTSCWAVRVYGSQVLLDDVTPNVGQWWYLFMEAFEDTKVYLRVLAHSLVFGLAPPLAMNLGVRRPLALFLVQLLCLGLIKPYPSVADLGLATTLLLLLSRQQLATMRLRLLLPASLALLCVLGIAMQRMWLSYESANSNFYYSITLIYGVWQIALLGQVLGLTLWVDRVVRGKEQLLDVQCNAQRKNMQQSAAAAPEVMKA